MANRLHIRDVPQSKRTAIRLLGVKIRYDFPHVFIMRAANLLVKQGKPYARYKAHYDSGNTLWYDPKNEGNFIVEAQR